MSLERCESFLLCASLTTTALSQVRGTYPSDSSSGQEGEQALKGRKALLGQGRFLKLVSKFVQSLSYVRILTL